MALPTTETVECDILIIGGGMSGCGAAFEANYWGDKLRVVMVEKAAIERSGATGEGLSAINCYMGQRYGWNTPADFVNYVVNDMMGLAREDLVYDVGRHVDSTVHLLEEWGLPIWKKENGEYERIGRWQIPIHGESIKPIAAEPARTALGQGNLYERVSVTHPAHRCQRLWKDSRGHRILGAREQVLRVPGQGCNRDHRRRVQRIPPPVCERGTGPDLVLGIRHWLCLRVDDPPRVWK